MAFVKKRFSSMPASTNVNLYCAQCEAQMGIFDNEWIRLTSSYARSKEKGTHFGTEVGQRTQVVPGGPSTRTAEGCEMAEVFCRKCSNMVGQYCKSAPDASKQSLVDQYFYKLSRTFLKNSRTNARVEPVFGYNPDALESTPGARMSIGPRASMTPSSRWMNTPLREASRTPSIQTATRSALRDHSVTSFLYEKPLFSPSLGAEEHVEASQQAMDILKQELAAQNSMLREHSNRLKNQAGQVSDHEACLRDHDARIEDQENCVRAQASRILEQDDIIADQRTTIKAHEDQLTTLRQQLLHLQQLVDNLHNAPVQEVRSDRLSQPHTEKGYIDFVGSFESLVRAMKEAQTTTHEAQLLREQNQDLQNRLNSIQGATAIVVNSDAGGEWPLQQGPGIAQALGKRKRDTPNSRKSSSRPTDSPTVNERRLVRFDEQISNQLPTPQSLQNHASPVQNPGMNSSRQLVDLHDEYLDNTETHRHADGNLAQHSFGQTNQEADDPFDYANGFVDETVDDSEISNFSQMIGASGEHNQAQTVTLTAGTIAQPALDQTAYGSPELIVGVNAVDATSTSQENPELPSRMNTRSSARAARRVKKASDYDLAESAHMVQVDAGTPKPVDVSHSKHSSILEHNQSHLPSVQTAGKVLGINLEPLQVLHQAFVAYPMSYQLAASRTSPHTSTIDQPPASSGTLQPSFDGQNALLRNIEPTRSEVADQILDQSEAALTAAQRDTAPSTVFIEDTGNYDDNVDFSDDDGDTVSLESHTDRDPNRRVTDTWINRDMRSMAPEPAKRRKTVSNVGPKYVTLDRIRLATPQTWNDAISKGLEPKLVRPPSINRRQLDLHEELTTLGLAEWIPRSKKSKEYRETVAAARAKHRDARVAEALQEKGLSHLRATSPSVPEQVSKALDAVPNDQVLSHLGGLGAAPALLSDAATGNENSPTLRPAQDEGSNTEMVGDNHAGHDTLMLTRSRARRSSASLDARLDDPEEAIRGVTADAGRPSRKRKSGDRNTHQRKLDMQPSVTTVPDTDHSAAAAQEDVTSTNEASYEVTAQPDVQQLHPVIKKGRGRPRKSQAPFSRVVDSTKLTEEQGSRVETFSDEYSSAALPTPATLPQERQKLLDSMRTRAQQKEDAIAARDLMAKQAIERDDL